MSNKIENEQVVNRFLLSTIYAIVAALGLYYLNGMVTGVGNRGQAVGESIRMAFSIFKCLYWIGAAGVVWFLIRKFALKKGTLYGAWLSFWLCVIGVFLRWDFGMAVFSDPTRRIMAAGVVVALLYIYELVVYFIQANKANTKTKK